MVIKYKIKFHAADPILLLLIGGSFISPIAGGASFYFRENNKYHSLGIVDNPKEK